MAINLEFKNVPVAKQILYDYPQIFISLNNLFLINLKHKISFKVFILQCSIIGFISIYFDSQIIFSKKLLIEYHIFKLVL